MKENKFEKIECISFVEFIKQNKFYICLLFTVLGVLFFYNYNITNADSQTPGKLDGFYSEIEDLKNEDKKVLNCGFNLDDVFGYEAGIERGSFNKIETNNNKSTLNKYFLLRYVRPDNQQGSITEEDNFLQLHNSIDLSSIIDTGKTNNNALFKPVTIEFINKIKNSKDKIEKGEYCTFDENYNILTGNNNVDIIDKGYILCDTKRMMGSDECEKYNEEDGDKNDCENLKFKQLEGNDKKPYCYGANHICNTYRQYQGNQKIYTIDEAFIKNTNNTSLTTNLKDFGERFYLFYKDTKPIDGNNAKNKNLDSVNCTTEFFDCDLKPYSNFNILKNNKDLKFKECKVFADLIKKTNSENIITDKDEFKCDGVNNNVVTVDFNSINYNYDKNQSFKKIINSNLSNEESLFIDDKALRCCLTDECAKDFGYQKCFYDKNEENSKEHNQKFIKHFENKALFKVINTSYYFVSFYQKNVTNKSCSNYLPACEEISGSFPVYNYSLDKDNKNKYILGGDYEYEFENKKIDWKTNVIEDAYLYQVRKISGSANPNCLYSVKQDVTKTEDNVEIKTTEQIEKDVSYCSDLLLNDGGELVLKYKNGYNDKAEFDVYGTLTDSNGQAVSAKSQIRRANCFLKSCSDLTDLELKAISGKSGIYCSPYNYLRNVDLTNKISLKFFPLIGEKIEDGYYCDYVDDKGNFKYETGINSKKDNCYLRSCLSFDFSKTRQISKKNQANLIDALKAEIKKSNDVPTVNDEKDNIRKSLPKYCENRIFFLQSSDKEFNPTSLNFISCLNNTSSSKNFTDVAYSKSSIGGFTCVNYNKIIQSEKFKEVTEVDSNQNKVDTTSITPFYKSVFSTLGDSSSSDSISSFSERLEKDTNGIGFIGNATSNTLLCQGVDNIMYFINADLDVSADSDSFTQEEMKAKENLKEGTVEYNNVNKIVTEITEKILVDSGKCVKETMNLGDSSSEENVSSIASCGDIKQPDSPKDNATEEEVGEFDTKFNQFSENLENYINKYKNYVRKNLVDCSVYDSSSIDVNYLSNLTEDKAFYDCKLQKFLQNSGKYTIDQDGTELDNDYYLNIGDNNNECAIAFQDDIYNDKIENIDIDNDDVLRNQDLTLSDISDTEPKYYFPVPTDKLKENNNGSGKRENFRTTLCTLGYNKDNLKSKDSIGCYPLDESASYIDLITGENNKNINFGSAPKDMTFKVIPVRTRYRIKNGTVCGEREGGIFGDGVAYLTDGDINKNGNVEIKLSKSEGSRALRYYLLFIFNKAIGNTAKANEAFDNYIAEIRGKVKKRAGWFSESLKSHAYSATKYGNNICVYGFNDFSHCGVNDSKEAFDGESVKDMLKTYCNNRFNADPVTKGFCKRAYQEAYDANTGKFKDISVDCGEWFKNEGSVGDKIKNFFKRLACKTSKWAWNFDRVSFVSSSTNVRGFHCLSGRLMRYSEIYNDKYHNYGGSIKDYVGGTASDFDNGVLSRYNVLQFSSPNYNYVNYNSGIDDTFNSDGIFFENYQEDPDNTYFYKLLNEKRNLTQYDPISTRDIVIDCIEKNGGKYNLQEGRVIVKEDKKVNAILRCIEKHKAMFIDRNATVNGTSDGFGSIFARKYKVSDFYKLENKITKQFSDSSSSLNTGGCGYVLTDTGNNSTENMQPFNIIKYIGNQSNLNTKNINCYLDQYGFPIGDLRYCRGIFTVDNPSNFDIYDPNSDIMKYFRPESQCLKLPLASAPQAFFTLATVYNTPSLFSPTLFLKSYFKPYITMNNKAAEAGKEMEVMSRDSGGNIVKTIDVKNVVVDFFQPKIKFSYDFEINDDDYKNKKENKKYNIVLRSELYQGESSTSKKPSEKLIKVEYESNTMKNSTYLGMRKGKNVSDSNFYYPNVCISTFFPTNMSNAGASVCDNRYKPLDNNDGSECFVEDQKDFLCLDRLVPTYKEIYMKLDNAFSYIRPYINVAIYDEKSLVGENITNASKYSNSITKLINDREDIKEKERIETFGKNDIQNFGLYFERSMCSQLDIEYYQKVDELQRLSKDNTSKRASLEEDIKRIEQIVKEDCYERQGGVSYVYQIAKTDNFDAQCRIYRDTEIISDNLKASEAVLLVQGQNARVQCKNIETLGKIANRLKLVDNPIMDQGHSEICLSDSNFKDMIEINKKQGTFDIDNNANQVLVYSTANSSENSDISDRKCLLNQNSRTKPQCLTGKVAFMKKTSGEFTLDAGLIIDEKTGLLQNVDMIDCEKFQKEELANLDDSAILRLDPNSETIRKMKYCLKGGYNKSGNIEALKESTTSVYDNIESDTTCECLSYDTVSSIPTTSFVPRDINKRELGLCIDLEGEVPVCRGVSYVNNNTPEDNNVNEHLERMKFTNFAEFINDLFSGHSFNDGYADGRWEHIWRTNERNFNIIGYYSKNSKDLKHAEFKEYPYCDLTKMTEEECFGGQNYAIGQCNGLYVNEVKPSNGQEKGVIARCEKIELDNGEIAYEFKLVTDTDHGGCIRNICSTIAYDSNMGAGSSKIINGDEENLIKYGSLCFTDQEKAAYNTELNAFNTVNHLGETTSDSIDPRGAFNGFALWNAIQSEDILVKQQAVGCMTGYGPAGTNYTIQKFFPYISAKETVIGEIISTSDGKSELKEKDGKVNYRLPFLTMTDISTNEAQRKRYERLADLYKEQAKIYEQFMKLSGSADETQDEGKYENFRMALLNAYGESLIKLKDNLPIRYCAQDGQWLATRDINNNGLISRTNEDSFNKKLFYYFKGNKLYEYDKNKNYDPEFSKVKYDIFDNKGYFFSDLDEMYKLQTNRNVLSDGVKIFESNNPEVDGDRTSRYCERLFCPEISIEKELDLLQERRNKELLPEAISSNLDSYVNYNVYDLEYDSYNKLSGMPSGTVNISDGLYITTDPLIINKYTPWRHTGGAKWEATSAPRNATESVGFEGFNNSDLKNTNLPDILNSSSESQIKTLYLKRVEGICEEGYGYYARGSQLNNNTFASQFTALKNSINNNGVERTDTEKQLNMIANTKVTSRLIGGDNGKGTPPTRTCSSIGLWSGVDNSCVKGCEMLDMYHAAFGDQGRRGSFSSTSKYATFNGGASHINKSFKQIDTIAYNDIKNIMLEADFSSYRVAGCETNNEDKICKYIIGGDGVKYYTSCDGIICKDGIEYKDFTDYKNGPVAEDERKLYPLGDYLTGGAQWPRTIYNNSNTKNIHFDKERNMWYINVEGKCDGTGENTFIQNVEKENPENSVVPTRRCYEDGTWGEIQNRCVSFAVCKQVDLNIFDLYNLYSLSKYAFENTNDPANMAKDYLNILISGKLNILSKFNAKTDAEKEGEDTEYKFVAKNFNKATITENIGQEEGQKYSFSDSNLKYNTEYGSLLFGLKVSDNNVKNGEYIESKDIYNQPLFTMQVSDATNPAETLSVVNTILKPQSYSTGFGENNAVKNTDGTYANVTPFLSYDGYNESKEECEDNKKSECRINLGDSRDEGKNGNDGVKLNKMQCNIGQANDSKWSFGTGFIGDIIYPKVCDSKVVGKFIGDNKDANKLLRRTRAFNYPNASFSLVEEKKDENGNLVKDANGNITIVAKSGTLMYTKQSLLHVLRNFEGIQPITVKTCDELDDDKEECKNDNGVSNDCSIFENTTLAGTCRKASSKEEAKVNYSNSNFDITFKKSGNKEVKYQTFQHITYCDARFFFNADNASYYSDKYNYRYFPIGFACSVDGEGGAPTFKDENFNEGKNDPIANSITAADCTPKYCGFNFGTQNPINNKLAYNTNENDMLGSNLTVSTLQNNWSLSRIKEFSIEKYGQVNNKNDYSILENNELSKISSMSTMVQCKDIDGSSENKSRLYENTAGPNIQKSYRIEGFGRNNLSGWSISNNINKKQDGNFIIEYVVPEFDSKITTEDGSNGSKSVNLSDYYKDNGYIKKIQARCSALTDDNTGGYLEVSNGEINGVKFDTSKYRNISHKVGSLYLKPFEGTTFYDNNGNKATVGNSGSLTIGNIATGQVNTSPENIEDLNASIKSSDHKTEFADKYCIPLGCSGQFTTFIKNGDPERNIYLSKPTECNENGKCDEKIVYLEFPYYGYGDFVIVESIAGDFEYSNPGAVVDDEADGVKYKKLSSTGARIFFQSTYTKSPYDKAEEKEVANNIKAPIGAVCGNGNDQYSKPSVVEPDFAELILKTKQGNNYSYNVCSKYIEDATNTTTVGTDNKQKITSISFELTELGQDINAIANFPDNQSLQQDEIAKAESDLKEALQKHFELKITNLFQNKEYSSLPDFSKFNNDIFNFNDFIGKIVSDQSILSNVLYTYKGDNISDRIFSINQTKLDDGIEVSKLVPVEDEEKTYFVNSGNVINIFELDNNGTKETYVKFTIPGDKTGTNIDTIKKAGIDDTENNTKKVASTINTDTLCENSTHCGESYDCSTNGKCYYDVQYETTETTSTILSAIEDTNEGVCKLGEENICPTGDECLGVCFKETNVDLTKIADNFYMKKDVFDKVYKNYIEELDILSSYMDYVDSNLLNTTTVASDGTSTTVDNTKGFYNSNTLIFAIKDAFENKNLSYDELLTKIKDRYTSIKTVSNISTIIPENNSNKSRPGSVGRYVNFLQNDFLKESDENSDDIANYFNKNDVLLQKFEERDAQNIEYVEAIMPIVLEKTQNSDGTETNGIKLLKNKNGEEFTKHTKFNAVARIYLRAGESYKDADSLDESLVNYVGLESEKPEEATFNNGDYIGEICLKQDGCDTKFNEGDLIPNNSVALESMNILEKNIIEKEAEIPAGTKCELTDGCHGFVKIEVKEKGAVISDSENKLCMNADGCDVVLSASTTFKKDAEIGNNIICNSGTCSIKRAYKIANDTNIGENTKCFDKDGCLIERKEKANDNSGKRNIFSVNADLFANLDKCVASNGCIISKEYTFNQGAEISTEKSSVNKEGEGEYLSCYNNVCKCNEDNSCTVSVVKKIAKNKLIPANAKCNEDDGCTIISNSSEKINKDTSISSEYICTKEEGCEIGDYGSNGKKTIGKDEEIPNNAKCAEESSLCKVHVERMAKLNNNQSICFGNNDGKTEDSQSKIVCKIINNEGTTVEVERGSIIESGSKCAYQNGCIVIAQDDDSNILLNAESQYKKSINDVKDAYSKCKDKINAKCNSDSSCKQEEENKCYTAYENSSIAAKQTFENASKMDISTLAGSSDKQAKELYKKLKEFKKNVDKLFDNFSSNKAKIIKIDDIKAKCIDIKNIGNGTITSNKEGKFAIEQASNNFENYYLNEANKFNESENRGMFKPGNFVALKCGTDGHWKAIDQASCKNRCNGYVGSDSIHLNPDGKGKYWIKLKAYNLRSTPKKYTANMSAVGMYCTRGNKDQTIHGSISFMCDNGTLNVVDSKVDKKVSYDYSYAAINNPGVNSHCTRSLNYFQEHKPKITVGNKSVTAKEKGESGVTIGTSSFEYYTTAATGDVERNNRGVIVTCPNNRVYHLVGNGHTCGLNYSGVVQEGHSIGSNNYDRRSHYGLWHLGNDTDENRRNGCKEEDGKLTRNTNDGKNGTAYIPALYCCGGEQGGFSSDGRTISCGSDADERFDTTAILEYEIKGGN